MSRARNLADYVSTGVTAAEFDFLDTTSGTPGSGTFLRGDKTWVAAGSTSASDLDSGTLAIARMASGTVVNVFRNKDTSSGTLVNASSTKTITQTAFSFSATSGRHYVISGSQWIAPYRASGTITQRVQDNWLYYGTTDGRVQGGTTLDTELSYAQVGRILVATSAVDAGTYDAWSYHGQFTAGSTATHYVYTVIASGGSDRNSRAYNDASYPHYTFILEVLP